jgi:hypothetical protein
MCKDKRNSIHNNYKKITTKKLLGTILVIKISQQNSETGITYHDIQSRLLQCNPSFSRERNVTIPPNARDLHALGDGAYS